MAAGKKIAIGCGITLLLLLLALGGGAWWVFDKANLSFDPMEIHERAASILPIEIPDECVPRTAASPDGEFETVLFMSEDENRILISMTSLRNQQKDLDSFRGEFSHENGGDVLEERELLLSFQGQEVEGHWSLRKDVHGSQENYFIPLVYDGKNVFLTISCRQGALSETDVQAMLDTAPSVLPVNDGT